MKRSIFEMTTEVTESAEDLLVKNMEYAAVIRSLRANAREDAQSIERLIKERDELREKYDIEATEHMLAINKLCNERDEARELARNLYSAGDELRRFTAAYAHNYDEVDGKPGALEAISDFYDASKDIAKILAEEVAK